ncbi:hypothetical protein BDZ90DRAFT_228212 [Jaminaea rosea]|uniref:Uncharacterized protein n=1 Tax=Jaminaea rosea TaxID=1569628 RepID=A0A316UKQ6_9BASI|nr:hypothetical protein BDZ90DRAFT_228212 [Jaminaea rosea]PWN25882.1 hypothetical protein BDZ90DRAFT_228212 [Jaminaea rosea]
MPINIWTHGSSSPVKGTTTPNRRRGSSPTSNNNSNSSSPSRLIAADGRAGIGIYYEDGHYRHHNLSEQVLAPRTDNSHWAELYALNRLLDAAPSANLVIKSDNDFAVKPHQLPSPPSVTSTVRFTAFEDEAPATLELMADIKKAVKQRRSAGHTVEFVHVEKPGKEIKKAAKLAEDAVRRAAQDRQVPVPYINAH